MRFGFHNVTSQLLTRFLTTNLWLLFRFAAPANIYILWTSNRNHLKHLSIFVQPLRTEVRELECVPQPTCLSTMPEETSTTTTTTSSTGTFRLGSFISKRRSSRAQRSEPSTPKSPAPTSDDTTSESSVAEIRALEKRLEDANTRISETEKQLEESKALLAHRETLLKQRAALLQNKETQIAERTREVVEGNAKIADLSKKLDDSQKSLGEAQKELSKRKDTVEKALKERDGAKEYASGFKSREDALRGELSAAKKSSEQSQKNMRDSRERVVALSKIVSTRDAELQKQGLKVTELSQKLKDIEEKLSGSGGESESSKTGNDRKPLRALVKMALCASAGAAVALATNR